MLALLLTVLACTTEPEQGADKSSADAVQAPAEKAKVITSSYPAAWLVDRLAQGSVDHENILPAGEDPPFWSPSGEVVAKAQQADLVVLNGAGFEAWVKTASLREGRVVDSAQGVETISVQSKTHSHGKDGEHSHAGLDPHTWSDPVGFSQQAQAVHAALSKLPGADQGALDAALGTLQADLKSLDQELKAATEPLQGKPMAASHPAFNYLARRYGLEITSFDFDPEQPPTDLHDFEHWAEGKAPVVLVWESAPTDAVKAAFPADVQHFVMDPLEQPGDSGAYDYLAQARANLDVLGSLAQAQ